MKQTIYSIMIASICLIGCSHGTSGNQSQCTFTKTILQRDSATWANLPGDTPEAYSYHTNAVAMDSLLSALCNKGISISEAWYCPNDAYLCKDAIGPRPVVILTGADTSMLSRGFVQGNHGRLACGDTLYRYRP